MKKIKEVSEDYMIAEFLLSEIDSENYSEDISMFLAQTKYSEDVIRNPNINDKKENEARKLILGYRGYPDSYLFDGLPKRCKWYHVQIQSNDFKQIKTINCESWITDTNHTRNFDVLINKIKNKSIINHKIVNIAADYKSNKKISMPIVLKDLSTGDYFVFEGNNRVAALLLNKTKYFDSIVGEFSNLTSWRWK